MTEPIRLLHVEDDEAFAKLTETALEREAANLTVTSVFTVTDAREQLDDGAFDCVVSDYDLPDENGLALLHWLRERDDRFPFILFTAKGSEEVASEAISAGVTEYIQKSGSLDQYELLAHRIENVVARYRTERGFEQLHRINETIREVAQGLVQAGTREEIDRLLCTKLAESEPYRFAWIGEHDPETGIFVPRTSAGTETNYLDDIEVSVDPEGDDNGPMATALLTGETQAVQDIRKTLNQLDAAGDEQAAEGWREAHDRGFRSVAAVPFVHDRNEYGVLAVYADRPEAFDDRELAVLSELGDTVANAAHAVEVREELRTSERNYREVFNKVNDAILVHDIETGEITDVNQKACEMLGYEKAELLDLSMGDFSRGEPPYTEEQAIERIRTAATEGQQLFEWAGRRCDGTQFWMEINLKRTVIGGRDRVLAVVRDVTERKEMEAKLAEGREKIEGLLEAASRMETCETESEVYDMAVSAAERILEFDLSLLSVAGERYFEVVAVSEDLPLDGTQRMELDEGIVGATYQSGDSELVDDIQANAVAKPAHEAYRSAISVPVGDIGVFQALSTETSFFSRDDLELAELLISHVKEAVKRVRSRQAVVENEEKFRELFHNANDAIFLVDVTDPSHPSIAEVNDVACERLGYDRDELVSMDPRELHPDETAAEWIDKVVEESDVTFESVHSTRDGAEIPVEINAHGFEFNGDDNVLAIARDVTDRREREETLNALHVATRRILRADDEADIAAAAVEAAKDALDIPIAGVLSYDEERDVLEPLAATADLEELFGGRENLTWQRSEGPPWRAFDSGETQHYLKADERAEFFAPADDVINLPLGRHGVFVIGSAATRTFDDADVEFAEILVANTEVSLDRATRERLLRERERDLREQRDQFAALFENVPDPAVVSRFEDGEPIVQQVNSAFEDVFGIPESEIVGENLDECVVPSDPNVEPVPLNRQSEEGEVIRAEVKCEAVGGIRDFLLHGVPIDIGELNTRAFAIYTDITERKRREQELAQQNEQLEEFASIVSHDLRNPLNVAQGHLQLAREEGKPVHFNQVESAHDRMEQLIQGVLALAREGQPAGKRDRIDLEAAVERAWSHVETRVASLAVEDDLPELQADEERVVRLLENLFRNAVEHAEPAVTVRVGPIADGFFVADDGPGVPESEREKLFEYGHTTQEDGTGFGLAIVERIVDAHGWSIDVTDAEGGGARFEVTISGTP